jgi:hypothetical protein
VVAPNASAANDERDRLGRELQLFGFYRRPGFRCHIHLGFCHGDGTSNNRDYVLTRTKSRRDSPDAIAPACSVPRAPGSQPGGRTNSGDTKEASTALPAISMSSFTFGQRPCMSAGQVKAGKPKPWRRIEAHGKQFRLDRLQRKSTACHVPSISRHRAARGNHPHHLCYAFGGIGNEEITSAITAKSKLLSGK